MNTLAAPSSLSAAAAAAPAPAGTAASRSSWTASPDLPSAAQTRAADPVRWLLGLALLAVAVVWATLFVVINNDHRNARQQAELSLANLTRAFAEHTAKTLEGADQAVRFVRSEYLRQGSKLDLPSYLQTQAIIDDDYHLLTVIGADGMVVASTQPFTKVDLREREHFKVHALRSEDKLFISKPVLGKVSGKWSIQVTRRIDDVRGQFAGVVVVSMPPSYFTRFYGDVDLGPHGLTTLVGTDGMVRARATRAGADQGQDISKNELFQTIMREREGVTQARSKLDGVERIFAFRQLDKYGLAVVTGMGVDDVFAESQERARLWVAIAVVVTAVIGLFTVVVVRRARRQSRLMVELRESQVRAEAANRLKSKFLASVSHELRTPLNGILGYAELLRDTSEDGEAREFGGIIHSSAQHLHQLVNTILDLAKIESGRLVTASEPTDLPELLQAVQRLHSVHAQQRGLTLALTQAADCPASIETDRTRLLQVLTNIVNNAIKFTELGSVTLAAAAREGGGVDITVTDTGIGIPPERQGNLFERFHAVSASWGIAGQGAGLGLPLAKELTERLGGELLLDSEPGRGTRITIRLPAKAPQAPVEA